MFSSRSGETLSELKSLAKVLDIYCSYAIKNKHKTICIISRQTLVDFLEHLRRKHPGSDYWKVLFGSFRRALRLHRSDLVWPKVGKLQCNPVEAHSTAAFKSMINALRAEIDRIRSKTGRLEKDLREGRIIDIHLNDFACKTQPDVYQITHADVIKTINHYLPDWPIVGRYSQSGYRLYDQKNRLIEIHAKIQDAEAAVAAKSLIIKHGHFPGAYVNNPGEWMLYQVANGKSYYKVGRYLNGLFSSTASLVDYYYPTSYDLTCVLMYWACLTGWNLETIRSVCVDDFNFDLSRNTCMDLLSIDHTIIQGKKQRGQADGRPKTYTHVSDKNNIYGLYLVLADYYELTKPIRRHLPSQDQQCLMIAYAKTLNKFATFGPHTNRGKQCPISVQNDQLRKFFLKHEIYENDDKKNRVFDTTSQKLRSTYESVLEQNDVPLYVRRYFLGHQSAETTTKYGSERTSYGIRKEKLRRQLDMLSNDWQASKMFQGATIPSSSRKKTNKAPTNNILQLFTGSEDKPVTICIDRYSPRWLGHEHSVKTGQPCNSFEQCLFCSNCRISNETLPYLYRWLEDLSSWRMEVGGADYDIQMSRYYSAINEALDQWEQEQGADELIAAETVALSTDFLSPPLWFRN